MSVERLSDALMHVYELERAYRDTPAGPERNRLALIMARADQRVAELREQLGQTSD